MFPLSQHFDRLQKGFINSAIYEPLNKLFLILKHLWFLKWKYSFPMIYCILSFFYLSFTNAFYLHWFYFYLFAFCWILLSYKNPILSIFFIWGIQESDCNIKSPLDNQDNRNSQLRLTHFPKKNTLLKNKVKHLFWN